MEPTDRSVEEFIAAVQPNKRRRDAETLISLMGEITGREPVLWSGSIVGFGSCHYRYETGTEGDMPILAFAPRKTASTLYLMPGFSETTDELAALGPHKTGKGCLYLSDLGANDATVLRGILEDTYREVMAEPTGYATITITG